MNPDTTDNKTKLTSYSEAIKEATEYMMAKDPRVYVFGLGVTYKNGADGTTGGLKEKFPDRVFDTPLSENSVTGMVVGSALSGLKPVIHHGRVEFAMFAFDQIFTQAAKWNYMFGGDNPVPVIFRICVGRQWGCGPQHSQTLYSLFGNMPGLKVIVPSTPYYAKGLLLSAFQQDDPVAILEPRWLYGTKQVIPVDPYFLDLNAPQRFGFGNDITVVTYGEGFHEVYKSYEFLKQNGINIDVVDIQNISDPSFDSIHDSLVRTGKLIVFEVTNEKYSVGSEIISHFSTFVEDGFLKTPPIKIGCPHVPCPTASTLTENFYPTYVDLIEECFALMDKKLSKEITLGFDELNLMPKTEIKI